MLLFKILYGAFWVTGYIFLIYLILAVVLPVLL
jgi:hypothetical protein